MNDCRDLRGYRSKAIDEIASANVRLDEREMGMRLSLGEIALLDSPWVERIKGVDADDLATLLQEALTEPRADEARGAGDEDGHADVSEVLIAYGSSRATSAANAPRRAASSKVAKRSPARRESPIAMARDRAS